MYKPLMLTTVLVAPLFGFMAGTWQGEGVRHMTASGRDVAVHVCVHAEVDGARLVSTNEIREDAVTDAQGTLPAREYTRTYWVQERADEPGRYDLGPSAAVGSYQGQEFTVEQDLGGEPALRVHSVTGFKAYHTFYRECLLQGDRTLAETKIEYHRVSQCSGN